MEYKSRSVRLDDEVWEAVRLNELSANRLLRRALNLDHGGCDVLPDGQLSSLPLVGKVSRDEFKRAIRPKGDKTR